MRRRTASLPQQVCGFAVESSIDPNLPRFFEADEGRIQPSVHAGMMPSETALQGNLSIERS